MLPVFGGFLFTLPILWQPDGSTARQTADGVVYVFVVWALLIVLAAILARLLGPALDEEEPPHSGALHGGVPGGSSGSVSGGASGDGTYAAPVDPVAGDAAVSGPDDGGFGRGGTAP